MMITMVFFVCVLLWKVIILIFESCADIFFQVDDEAVDLNKELMSKLLELDDVDAVYTDQK